MIREGLLGSTATQSGFTTKSVLSSSDTARTSTLQGSAPPVDLPQGLAACGSVVILAGVGGSSVLQRSADRDAAGRPPTPRTPPP